MITADNDKDTTRPIRIHRRFGQTLLALACMLAAAPVSIQDSEAAFTLNFQNNYAAEGATLINDNSDVVCNMSYIASQNCSNRDFQENGNPHDDGSAFLQQHVVLNGVDYYHIIVGDYTKDSFVQEMYIQADGQNYQNGNNVPNFSASVGSSSSSNAEFDMTNPYSSNSSLNGNGSANPTAVILLQVINEPGEYQEFLKDSFTSKPLITETISDSNMTAQFTIDMRGLTYSSSSPISASNMVNTVTLTGSNAFGTAGDAGTASQLDQYHITAGAFTYTPGSSSNGGGGGTYTYVEPFPNFSSPMNIDYSIYCDPSQNTNWSGNGACVDGDGSGGSWGKHGGGW